MKRYKYTGFFDNQNGHIYKLNVLANGWLQAFFLLTAKAIQNGTHYQLHSIQDSDGEFRMVGDIDVCRALLTDPKTIDQ